jgi:hypothetical protein
MALANYNDLKASVASWLARSDLTSQIPDFITLAEAKLNRSLRVRQMEQRSTATAAEYMALPTLFQEMRNIKTTGTPVYTLEQRAPFEMDALDDGSTGRPSRYALIANQIRLAPAPDTTYTLEIDYWESIPPLADNATNWLLTAAPDIYLYGSLLEAAAFMLDDPRIPLWQAAYTQVIGQLQSADRRARWSGSPLAVRPA